VRYVALLRGAFALAWREGTAYRFSFAMSFLVIALPFTLQVFLWRAVFSGRASLAGYSFSRMVAYYVLALLLFDFVQPTLLYDVADDIKSGNLAAHLLRPVPYPLWSAGVRFGSQAVYLVVVALTVGLISWLLVVLGYLNPGEWSLERAAAFLLVFALAWLVGLLLSLAVSFAVFFTEDASGLSKVVGFVFPLFSGALIPLDLLPRWLQIIGKYLPFRWLVYEPIRVFSGRAALLDVLPALLAWALLAALLAWLLWRAGEARFTAVGG